MQHRQPRTMRPPNTSMFSSLVGVVRRGKRGNSHVITARKQSPPDPGRPSLLQLPDDIIFNILSHIHDVSPETVLEFALVCSYCYEQARYIQHRDVTIDLANNLTSNRFRLDYMTQNNLLPAIRTIRILTAPSVLKVSPKETKQAHAARLAPTESLTHLAQLLPQMTGLRDVHWHEGKRSMHSIPEELASLLKKHPKITLHLFFESIPGTPSAGLYPDSVSPEQSVTALQGAINLVSLDVRATFNRDDQQESRAFTTALRDLILTSPNLQTLSLNILETSRIRNIFSNYTGLGFSSGSRPPPLTDLQISDYPWGQAWHPANIGPGHPNPILYPNPGIEQTYWADKFDWSSLHRFRENKTPILTPHITRHLIALKEVEFNFHGSTRNINNPHAQQTADAIFLKDVPSLLSSISINSLTHVGLHSLKRHVSHLRKLVIHTPEAWSRKETTLVSSYGWNQLDGFINHYDLQQLCDALPQLEEFGIDMDRGGTERDEWPRSMLSILAGFPRLRRLGIWFELGAMGDAEAVPRPYLDWGGAVWIYEYLRERRVQKGRGVGLERLEVNAGTPCAPGGGLDGSRGTGSGDDAGNWARNNATGFVCELALWHGDGFTVRCPWLSNVENRRLERMAKGEEKGVWNPEVDSFLFRAAMMGPVGLEEWEGPVIQRRLRQMGESLKGGRKGGMGMGRYLPWREGGE